METQLLRSSTKNVASVVVFASLYTVFSFWPLFPLIGGEGQFIKAGNIVAPLFGIILGPWLGASAIMVGGVVGAFIWPVGAFGIFSFLPHLAASVCAGLLHSGRRWLCAVCYLTLLLAFAFYPIVGPAWLWPSFLWLHVAVLAFMFSPLQSKAADLLREDKKLSKLTVGLAATCFSASLFGHVVGSLMFEVVYWPAFISEVGAWTANWQLLMWLYPIERVLIAVAATLVGTGLLKALRNYGFNVDS